MGKNKRTSRDEFFNSLYSGQFLKMRMYARTIIQNHNLAEEVVQDAFVEVLLHIEHLMKTELPELWLQRTVKNKSLHVLRDQIRYTWRLVSLEEQKIVDNSTAKELQEIDEFDSISQIRKTITKTLNIQEIHLLRRIAMEGATYKAVSEETGMSIAACQKKIQRIRKKLKKHISEK